MVRIVIPACGSNQVFLNEYWPKNVTEVNGKVMLQYVVENFDDIEDKDFTFILNQKECAKFHTDSMAKLITNGNANIIQLAQETGGALCTSLMAIEYINNSDELIITNNDHKFDCDMNEILDSFRVRGADCGVVTFECVHPRWSYIRMENDMVIEAAEKRPISKHAIAGVYYYKKGSDFVKAAKNAIIKGRSHEGKFFLSAAINEMILLNKKVVNYEIDVKDYHTFYEPKQIEKYELEMKNR